MDKLVYNEVTMNHKASKNIGTAFLAIICLVLGYYGWYYYFGPGQHVLVDTNTQTEDDKSQTADTDATVTTPTTTPADTSPTDTTVKVATFSKTGFNFTFQYPTTWAVVSSTISSGIIAQKTVKIKTDKGIEFSLANPTVATGSEEYTLNHPKDIKSGSLTFKRNFGQNAGGQTLYVATYTDPNNFDASSVSFYGSGTIDDAIINDLDLLLSSFQFK